jgi:DNA-binding transcriptional LysR family regulator
MDLQQVRYFLALCKSLNFTRAAEACNITQPALTKAIRRLEDELGGPLFFRERNLTQLSELGRELRPHLEQSFASATAAKLLAIGYHKQETAAIRLGLLPSTSASLVARPLAEVARRIPAVELQIRQADQPHLVEDLLHGALDVALLAQDSRLPERLNRWPVFEEKYEVMFTPEHRFAAQETVRLADLADEIVLGRESDEEVEEVEELQTAAAAAGWVPRFRHRCATEEHVQHLVAEGFGIALVPGHLPVLPGLERRPLDECPMVRVIVLAAVSGRRYSAAVDAFVRLNRARGVSTNFRTVERGNESAPRLDQIAGLHSADDAIDTGQTDCGLPVADDSRPCAEQPRVTAASEGKIKTSP